MHHFVFCFFVCFLLQREKESATRREVAVDRLVEEINTVAGAKSEAVAAERNAAAAESERAETAAALPGPHGNTRSTGAFQSVLSECAFNVKICFLVGIIWTIFCSLTATLRGERGRKELVNTGMFLLQDLNTSHQCNIKLCKVPACGSRWL